MTATKVGTVTIKTGEAVDLSEFRAMIERTCAALPKGFDITVDVSIAFNRDFVLPPLSPPPAVSPSYSAPWSYEVGSGGPIPCDFCKGTGQTYNGGGNVAGYEVHSYSQCTHCKGAGNV